MSLVLVLGGRASPNSAANCALTVDIHDVPVMIGGAFDSTTVLVRRYGGLAVLEGGALVVAGSVIALAKAEGRDVPDVTAELLASAD